MLEALRNCPKCNNPERNKTLNVTIPNVTIPNVTIPKLKKSQTLTEIPPSLLC